MLNNQHHNRRNEDVNKYPYNKKDTSSKSCSTCSSTSSKEILQTTKLNVILTNKGLQIYGSWSTEKLLKLLTNRLRQSIFMQSNKLKMISNDITISNDKRLWITIYSGLYSIHVLRELKRKGMSIHSIMKAMKLGLINLSYCELLYFKEFKVEPYILEFKEIWSSKLSDELILNLRPTGLNEIDCWNIIIHGVVLQRSSILRHLILSGIDVPGILNWQSPVNFASPKIVEFLKHIGIEENVIQIIEQYGIDEETEQMLIDLGLNEMEEKFSNMEELLYECSLTVLESNDSCSEIIQDTCKISSSKSSSNFIDVPDYFQQCVCQCHLLAKNKTLHELTAQRNDYLRRNVMVPLSWAMAKTLKYKSSDPVHFMAYQLLKWTYNNISQIKKDNLQDLIALSTIEMDQKLIVKKHLVKKLIKNVNQKSTENIPYSFCKDEELYHIKKQCRTTKKI